MATIHLIERGDFPENLVRLDAAAHEWESGFWYVSKETAERLVGGTILLHEAQDKPSRFGGEILGYRVVEDGPDTGKVAFRFRASKDAVGRRSGPGGWGMEKRIDW